MKRFLFLLSCLACIACLLSVNAPVASACPPVQVGYHAGYANPQVSVVAAVPVVQYVQPVVQQQVAVAAVQPQAAVAVAAPQTYVASAQPQVVAFAQPTLAVAAVPIVFAQQYSNYGYGQNVGFAFNQFGNQHHVGQVFGNNGHHNNGQVVVAAPQNAKVVVNVKNGKRG